MSEEKQKDTQIIKIEQSKNELIIHQSVVRFRGSLTSTQSKGIFVLLKHANVSKTNIENLYSISFDEFEKLFGSNIKSSTTGLQNRKDTLYKAMKEIIKISFYFGLQNEEEESVLLQYFKISKDTIYYQFGNYIQERIKPIAKFLILNDFELFMSFKSEYSRQLYKHIMSWFNLKNHLTIDLKDLKDFLGVKASYREFQNLEARVLLVAVKEINSKTNINLSYKKDKVGKQIVSISFFWDNQKKLSVSKC